jgi:hypothetical protein
MTVTENRSENVDGRRMLGNHTATDVDSKHDRLDRHRPRTASVEDAGRAAGEGPLTGGTVPGSESVTVLILPSAERDLRRCGRARGRCAAFHAS